MPDTNDKDVSLVPVVTASPLFPPTSGFPIQKIPTRADPAYIKRRLDLQKDYLDESELVRATQGGEVVASLKMVATSLARNIEILEFRRKELETTGSDTSQTILKQSELLLKLSSVLFELRKLKADSIDLRSAQFKKVFEHLVETISNTAKESLPQNYADIFLQQLVSDLDGWEDRAEALLGFSY